MTPIGSYADRYIEIRSNGSISKDTIKNEQRYLQYIDAAIGTIPICKVTAEDIKGCLLMVPELSEKWALERQSAWEESRKTARWAKKHGALVKPFRPIKVAGSDMQSKASKFLREVMDPALEKEGALRRTSRRRSFSPACSRRASRSSAR